jgi:hypothetical protein
MGIQPEARVGELGHVVATDEDEAGGTQTRNDRRIAERGGMIFQEPRAGGCDFPGHVEQVFQRNRNAGE